MFTINITLAMQTCIFVVGFKSYCEMHKGTPQYDLPTCLVLIT